MSHFQTLDDYIACQSPTAQEVLQQVRGAICKALPKAEESISYQIPTYKLNGHAVLYFAGWKKTIRSPLSQPVPVQLIGRIAKFRAKEVAKQP